MSSTHVVELTPAGRGAVAVVLVAGPEALRMVEQFFRSGSGRPLSESPLNRIVVGRWGGDEGEEVVVCRRGENEVEVHCHGGHAAVAAVVSALVKLGARAVPWREWVARGRVSPRPEIASQSDGAKLAAQIALADAITERTALILLDQLNGALSRSIADAIESIESGDWKQAARTLDGLLKHRETGLHLTAPWRVVFAGPPNVGKSSLINALVGFQRAIVSPTPGTTRDVVTATTAIDGWPVMLADTAGLRETGDALESAGVALARDALATADLAVVVEDATAATMESLQESLQLPARVIWVRNKVDLVGARELGGGDTPVRADAIRTSALTGQGIAELIAAIGAALVPNPPAAGEAVPFTAAQVEALVVAHNAVQRQHAAAAVEALRSVVAVS